MQWAACKMLVANDFGFENGHHLRVSERIPKIDYLTNRHNTNESEKKTLNDLQQANIFTNNKSVSVNSMKSE